MDYHLLHVFDSVSAIAQNRGNVDCHLLHVFDSVSAVAQNRGNVDCHLLHVFDSVSAIAQNRGNVDCHLLHVFDSVSAIAQNRQNVDCHLLHVFDSVSAIVENGGNVTEGGIGPVQAVIKGQQVVRLSDALVHQHRAASAIHQALHNSRRTSPCAVEQQPWKKQTEKKIPFIMHFVRIPKCWRTAALEKQIGKKIPSIMLLCTS